MTDISARRLVELVLVSLNGVISEPHVWTGAHFGERSVAASLERLRRSDAMLMGRGTYDLFSRLWPNGSGEYVEHINAMPKYVFSNTLDHAEWNNTTVVSGDVVDEVTALKETAGGDLVVYGHGQFGQTLCDAGLVDELGVLLVPVFVADGTPMFRPGGKQTEWQLTGTAESDPGTVVLTYRPVLTAHASE